MYWRIVFQVAATYVGAVMGAGFASGQEIQEFFARFGYQGLWGILISAALFSLLGWVMLDLQKRWQINSYAAFFQSLLGVRWGGRADLLVSALLFVGLLAMLSGAGALFHEYFGLSRWTGITLTVVVTALALWYRGEGVLWINSVLIPLKFLFCLGIGAVAIFFAASGDGEGIRVLPNPIVRNWAASGILYVSFNLTLAMVVFASLGKEVHRPGARLGAVGGGIALGVFAFAIGTALLRFPEVMTLEIPMVAVAAKLGGWPAFFYVMVLWLAMITAAVGDGFSLACRLSQTRRLGYIRACALILLAALALAGIRFSQLVRIVYPLCGYLGLAFLPFLFYSWRRRG